MRLQVNKVMLFSGVIVAFSIAARFWFISSITPTCDSKVLWENVAPGRNSVMTSSQLDCGATTDYTIVLSVRKEGAVLDLKKEGDVVLTMDRADHVQAKWFNDSEIDVVLPATGRVFKQKFQWGDVKIIYRTE
jgi:hypothetical protein